MSDNVLNGDVMVETGDIREIKCFQVFGSKSVVDHIKGNDVLSHFDSIGDQMMFICHGSVVVWQKGRIVYETGLLVPPASDFGQDVKKGEIVEQ